MQEHRIKFWGVRGSFPTPDRDKIEVGGHSSCVEIRTSENELIIFASDYGKKAIAETWTVRLSKQVKKLDQFKEFQNYKFFQVLKLDLLLVKIVVQLWLWIYHTT